MKNQLLKDAITGEKTVEGEEEENGMSSGFLGNLLQRTGANASQFRSHWRPTS